MKRDDRQAPSDFYAVRVFGSFNVLDALLRTTLLDIGCSRPQFEQAGPDKLALSVLASIEQAESLKSQGLEVEIGENISEFASKLKHEVGKGDRFKGGKIAPVGFGVVTLRGKQ